MRPSRLLLVLALFALPLLGCGKECDKCDSDDDCDSDQVCSRFEDGSQRCGKGDGTTTCRVLR